MSSPLRHPRFPLPCPVARLSRGGVLSCAFPNFEHPARMCDFCIPNALHEGRVSSRTPAVIPPAPTVTVKGTSRPARDTPPFTALHPSTPHRTLRERTASGELERHLFSVEFPPMTGVFFFATFTGHENRSKNSLDNASPLNYQSSHGRRYSFHE